MKTVFLSFFMFFGMTSIVSQDFLSFSVFPGFLITHSEYMPHMAAHTVGGNIDIKFEGTGNKFRDSLFNHIQWGASMYFNHIGKTEINGNTLALIPYFQIRLKSHKNSESMLRIGSGIGYCTKIFDPFSNPKNRAMSSRFNGVMQFVFLNNRPLSKNTEFFYGLGMTHFSNANFHRPNLGINTPQINIGLNFVNPYKFIKIKPSSSEPSVLSYFETRLGHGMKASTVSDPTMFSVYTLSFTQGIGITPIRNFRFGLDIFYDKLDPYVVFNLDSKKGFKVSDALETALKTGYEYNFGKVTYNLDLGYYLYKPDVGKLNYYLSLGVNYHWKKFVIGTRLKSHAANADFIDFSLGYRFDTKNYLKVK